MMHTRSGSQSPILDTQAKSTPPLSFCFHGMGCCVTILPDGESHYGDLLARQLAYAWRHFVTPVADPVLRIWVHLCDDPHRHSLPSGPADLHYDSTSYVAVTRLDGMEAHLALERAHTAGTLWRDVLTVESTCVRALWLALLASGRGLLLHASSVMKDGRALAFSGPSDSGKTTFAWMAAAAGFTVIHDELTPILLDLDATPPIVRAPPIYSRYFQTQPVSASLAAVFFVAPAEETNITRLPISAATALLMQHGGIRNVRYRDEQDPTGQGILSHMAMCSRVAAEVPCYRWDYRLDADLPRLAEQHLASTGCRNAGT